MDLSSLLNGIFAGGMTLTPAMWVILAVVILYPALRARFPQLPDLSALITALMQKILGGKKPSPLAPVPVPQPTPDAPLPPGPDQQFPILSALLKMFLAAKGIPLTSVVDTPSETLLSVKAELEAAIDAKKAKHAAEVAALGK